MSKLTEAQKIEICERYKNGESTCQLSSIFGILSSSVRRLLIFRGVEIRGGRATNRERYKKLMQYKTSDILKHRTERNNRKKRYWAQLKYEVLSHYSNGAPKCNCCGENILVFLNIDHINGGGVQHRRNIKRAGIYGWLKANNYPEEYQVLCANCNLAKSILSQCPHQRKG